MMTPENRKNIRSPPTNWFGLRVIAVTHYKRTERLFLGLDGWGQIMTLWPLALLEICFQSCGVQDSVFQPFTGWKTLYSRLIQTIVDRTSIYHKYYHLSLFTWLLAGLYLRPGLFRMASIWSLLKLEIPIALTKPASTSSSMAYKYGEIGWVEAFHTSQLLTSCSCFIVTFQLTSQVSKKVVLSEMVSPVLSKGKRSPPDCNILKEHQTVIKTITKDIQHSSKKILHSFSCLFPNMLNNNCLWVCTYFKTHWPVN